MESAWTNKFIIKRDLYKAQGKIPGDVPHIISSKAKPIDRIILEENYIEHFSNCSNTVEFRSGPDGKLIQQMLHMLKERNICTNNIPCNPVELIEIDRSCIVNSKPIVDNMADVCNVKLDNKVVHKEKRQRNMAIASLLDMLSKDDAASSAKCSKAESSNDKHLILLKPEDFISKTKTDQMVKAVHSTFDELSQCNQKNCVVNKKDLNENPKTESRNFVAYKPSSMADVYYKQYLVRSKLREVMRDYYQSKIEKTMENLDVKELAALLLPQHRHLLSEDCIVCEVLYKRIVQWFLSKP